jgi:hypothetical protein
VLFWRYRVSVQEGVKRPTGVPLASYPPAGLANPVDSSVPSGVFRGSLLAALHSVLNSVNCQLLPATAAHAAHSALELRARAPRKGEAREERGSEPREPNTLLNNQQPTTNNHQRGTRNEERGGGYLERHGAGSTGRPLAPTAQTDWGRQLLGGWG